MSDIAIDQETATKLMTAVDDLFEAEIALTSELVSFPSTRGNEATAQDFMAGEFRTHGLDVDRWCINVDDIRHLPGFSPVSIDYDDSYNVVGAHRAINPKGRSLILNGHIDVVPEGPHDMWAHPPFHPICEDNWLYGRGSGDMKSGLAACVTAFDAMRKCGYQPAADVFIQSVAEEECTGNGALACLARGYRAEAALIPEPFNNTLMSAQIGVMWFQVKVRGIPVHVLQADSGSNAIEAAFDLIQGLKVLETKWNEERVDHPHYADHHHPINFNVGRIEGGDWASSVPAWCVFDMRVAIYPGDDLASRQDEIETCIMVAARDNSFLRNSPPEITYNGFLAEGYELKDADNAERVLRQSHQLVFGEDLVKAATTATTDARFFGLYAGILGLVYGPASDGIHGFDERVDLESLRKITQSITLFMANWCGLEKNNLWFSGNVTAEPAF